LVAFVISNPIHPISQTGSIQSVEKECIPQILSPCRTLLMHVIMSHSTAVRMIGHLDLVTSHASWAWLTKICPRSQVFLRCVWANRDLIMN